MPILLFECHRSEEEKGDLFNYLVDLGYTGYFFHVTQKDHANIFRRGIGEYIHFINIESMNTAGLKLSTEITTSSERVTIREFI